MFRRRREASFRPPASSAWWPAGADSAGPNLAPALPTGDPFGGWPAFPVNGTDPTDPVLGQPDPLASWGTPAAAPPPSSAAAFPAPPAAFPAPPAAPPVPAAAPVPDPPGADLPTTWMPLLTHDDDKQPFQARPETSDTDRADTDRAGSGPSPRESRRVRNSRRRGAGPRAVSTAPELPEPVASPEPRVAAAPIGLPAPEMLADTAFANGATTWLDPVAPLNPMEAAALAGAFAADYLSWDESSPDRRGQVLAQYLPSDVVGSAALLGWSGKGRQRAEFSLPGAVHPDGDGRVVVDVRVRVTPYRAVGQPADPAPAGELEVAGVPAVAPAPTARGWKSLDSYWVRMTVPITRDQGRLVVDTWDEQLDEDGEDTAGPGSDVADPVEAEDLDAVVGVG
jgi:hypothetical protein